MNAPLTPEAAPKVRASGGGVRPVRRPPPVNLARRPFANTRYIRRLGIALWILGALLLALDGYLYWRSLFGIESKKEERAAIEKSIVEERERLAAAERQLATMDLERQNVEASYLNERIAQRTFPWSALFDQLAEVLPKRVRLYSLSPQSPQAQRATARTAMRAAAPGGPRRVYLQLTGVAESDEALLELIDNLFAHPAFDEPALPGEARKPDGVQFSLNVSYLPGKREERETAGSAEAAEVVEDAPAGPAAEGAP